MIKVEPVETGVTSPLSEPTVAMVGSPLLHSPPVAVSVKVTGYPIHMDDGPDMGAGVSSTVKGGETT